MNTLELIGRSELLFNNNITANGLELKDLVSPWKTRSNTEI